MGNALEQLRRVHRLSEQLVETLRRELRPLGLTVVPVAPGGVAGQALLGSARPVATFRCEVKGCGRGPFKARAALIAHAKTHAAGPKGVSKRPARTTPARKSSASRSAAPKPAA